MGKFKCINAKYDVKRLLWGILCMFLFLLVVQSCSKNKDNDAELQQLKIEIKKLAAEMDKLKKELCAFESDTYDYFEALEMSRAQNKPVLLDFTGHGCVNCREMEASVLTDGNVLDMLEENFIVASLYVDDREELDEPFVGKDGSTYYEVGEKWSYLQTYKFGTVSQPFYVIVDSYGDVMGNRTFAYNKNVNDFLRFLKEGLHDFNKRHL